MRVRPLLRVDHGSNDVLVTDDGQTFVDLISSTGAVLLGHANEAVNRHVTEQMGRISCSWTSVMDIQDRCKEVVDAHTGGSVSLLSLYSSGMEAAEVAMRIAFHETKRAGIVGFRHNHHGKSVAIQNVTGPDPDLPTFDTFRRIPFVPQHSEADVLGWFEEAVEPRDVAAVFVEPMQGRGGGHAASVEFYAELQRLCRHHGVLVICDEIFTGFHRTGPCFRHPALGIDPDIVLAGKALANGFPAAAVLLAPGLRYHPKDFRLSSTFSDNPLACAAVVGTIGEMERIDVEERVADIERSLRTIVGGPASELRLAGAACFLELETPAVAAQVHDAMYERGVLALRRGPVLGLWPPATITDDHLTHVVDVVNEALERARQT